MVTKQSDDLQWNKAYYTFKVLKTLAKIGYNSTIKKGTFTSVTSFAAGDFYKDYEEFEKVILKCLNKEIVRLSDYRDGYLKAARHVDEKIKYTTKILSKLNGYKNRYAN